MKTNLKNSHTIKKEAANIGKYAGLNCSRIALLVCLLILFYPMRPTAVYLFTITALFPWIFSNVLEGKSDNHQPSYLPFCAKKYLYSPSRYLAERYTGNAIIPILILWQITVSNSSVLHGVWKIAPALCLLVYCLCRLISTLFFRQKIHGDYLQLKLLDDESDM